MRFASRFPCYYLKYLHKPPFHFPYTSRVLTASPRPCSRFFFLSCAILWIVIRANNRGDFRGRGTGTVSTAGAAPAATIGLARWMAAGAVPAHRPAADSREAGATSACHEMALPGCCRRLPYHLCSSRTRHSCSMRQHLVPWKL